MRESTAQNERVKAMHMDEVDYLMEQLTKREKEISSLSRSLTVAEVDSDWRRLLGISKAGGERKQERRRQKQEHSWLR